MQLISRLEQNSRLDGVVSAGQRVARLIRPAQVRDALHGVWLGHPLHPMLIQASVGTWLSASMATVSVSGLLGGHISFRLAGGVNHAEEVSHLVKPGWQYLMPAADLPEGRPVRQMLGEVPVVAIRSGGAVHVLAERCSHMSGPLSDGDFADGCLTCPWHGSVFRIADGSVARGPATAPQPAFEACEADGAIRVCLPGAG